MSKSIIEIINLKRLITMLRLICIIRDITDIIIKLQQMMFQLLAKNQIQMQTNQQELSQKNKVSKLLKSREKRCLQKKLFQKNHQKLELKHKMQFQSKTLVQKRKQIKNNQADHSKEMILTKQMRLRFTGRILKKTFLMARTQGKKKQSISSAHRIKPTTANSTLRMERLVVLPISISTFQTTVPTSILVKDIATITVVRA